MNRHKFKYQTLSLESETLEDDLNEMVSELAWISVYKVGKKIVFVAQDRQKEMSSILANPIAEYQNQMSIAENEYKVINSGDIIEQLEELGQDGWRPLIIEEERAIVWRVTEERLKKLKNLERKIQTQQMLQNNNFPKATKLTI